MSDIKHFLIAIFTIFITIAAIGTAIFLAVYFVNITIFIAKILGWIFMAAVALLFLSLAWGMMIELGKHIEKKIIKMFKNKS